MSNIRLIHNNEKGMVLPLGLIFLAIIVILGATAVIVTTTDLKIGSNYRASQQAFYAAEACTNRAMSTIEKDIIFGSVSPPVTITGQLSGTVPYTCLVEGALGPVKPKAGYEVGAWDGAGFNLEAPPKIGTAQSRIEMLARATVPIGAYTGGK